MNNLITWLNPLVALDRRITIGRFGTAVAIAATLVVGPLLAFSETTLKSVMDSWLSQCTIVVDIRQQSAEAPIVRLYSFGDMPKSLPLTFSTENGLIERVSFLNHIEQKTAMNDPNLLVHPLANQRCPGELCPDTIDPMEKLTIRVQPVSSNYVYQFRVLTSPPITPSQLKVYVNPRLDEVIPCRVEATNVFNYFARQPRSIQALFLFLGIMVFTLLIGYLRDRSGGAS